MTSHSTQRREYYEISFGNQLHKSKLKGGAGAENEWVEKGGIGKMGIMPKICRDESIVGSLEF